MQLSKQKLERFHIRLWREYSETKLDATQLFFLLQEYFGNMSSTELSLFIDNLVEFKVLSPKGNQWIVEPPIHLI